MSPIGSHFKWIGAFALITLILERTARGYGAAICTPPCLLFSNTTDIIAVDYKTSVVHSVVTGLTRAVALDVHFSMGYIFWSDVSEQNIKRSGIDGSSITTIITSIGVCDGLAVQWTTSELYWTDTTHDTISKSDLSGNNQQTVLSLGLDEPRDISVDPDKGLMIWTDWGSSPKIEKASLTGNQRVAIVTSNIHWPNGIELDRWNNRIYWVDGAVDQLESVDYDGNDRKLLSTVTNFHGFGVAIIPPFLFFTDWASNGQIHQVDAKTGYFVVSGVRFTGRPMGIVAYDSSRQPPVSSSCATNNGGCSHFCVVKTSGGHECVCPVGLSLKADGKTCNKKMDKFLVFTDADAKSTNIISLDVNYFGARRLFFHHGNQRPIAVDYDPVEDRVYWTDVAQGLIISAISNATSLRIPFRCNVKVPDGLAIDHVGQNIYWTDTGTNRIEVARLDGTSRKLLINDGLDEPRAIVLDERNGTMYWSDWGSNPMIEQAAMDGSSRRTIVTGNLGWPNGLTIDQTTSLLYWADAKLDKIEVSNLNGDNRRVIMLSAADIHPFGLTVYKSILYWTDWNNKSISRYDLNNGNTEVIIQGLQKPMDIHLYDSSRVFSGSHPCTINNGNCSDLCLLTPQGGHQCACPTGVVLKPDGKNCNYDLFKNLSSDKFMVFAEANSGEIYKVPLAVPDTPCSPLGIKTNISRPVAVDYDPIEGKVYWTDVALKQVVRSFPNGSDLEVIAESNVENPDGIAVDWIGRNVYWTDDQTSKIEVSRLDGSYRFSLITSGLDNPRAVILDIDARKMYWSDWGASPKIEQANMDGTARTALVSSGLSWVNSLALDFKNRLLYWCDAQLDKIERVDLQGNNRVLILDLSSNNDTYHPFGLALYEDALFWTDWTTKSVHRYNMTSSLSDVLVHGMGTPMEIHIYDYSIITSGTTSCSHLNGGCSHICLPNPNGHQCFCPEGVYLIPGDSLTCQGVNRCPQLFAPVHGSLLPCSNLPGQSCVFSCDQGYLLSGANTRTCQGDGSWSGVQTYCTVVTCPALPTPSNGTRQGCSGASTEIYNTVCQFSCNPGFVSLGSSSRTCLQNGSWSGQDFVCQAIICPPLATPPKALLLTPSCGSTYGSSCRYSCQSGYTSFTGKVTRTCLLNGQWSENDINCTDIQPPDFGATCPAKPLTAYAEREMLSALVNWTQPVATDNSEVSITLTSNYQSPTRFSQGTHVITYTAVDQSGNKATCTFLVIILVINCTSLRVSPGGPLQMDSCGDHYGSKCNFSCSVGYRLNGSSTVTCNAPGNSPPGVWDSPIPLCQEITCQSYPDLINGVTRGCADPVSERYGTICSFSCNVGYNLTGSSRRQCLENGTWSGLAPTCQVVNCSVLTPPANGTVSPRSCLSRSTYGQTCSFSCNTPGYVLEGTSARVCDKNGEWTGNKDTFCRDNTPPSFNGSCPRNIVVSVPKCSSSTVVSWNEPIASDNSGHMTLSYPAVRPPANLSIGLHYVHYSAADAEGNRANCSFVVQVIKRSCTVLQPPVYGAITSLSCGSAYGSQAVIACNEGHRLVGSRVWSCEANGTWSGNVTTCKTIICPPLATPPKALLLTPSCESTYGSSCRYSCQSGYTSFTGKVTRTCLLNGQWSGNDINCTDTQPPDFGATCPVKPLTAYAEREMLSALVNWTQPVATDNSEVSITLTSNYQSPTRFSQGTHVITYTAVDQSGNKATCTFLVIILVINCTSLRVSPGGPLQMDSCGDHYGSKCNFSCSVGYRLNGSSSVTCNAPGNTPPGVWDSPIPVCQEIACQSHPDLINGVKRGCADPVSERYGAICSFSCNVGYNLTGSSRRQCLENGTWSGVAPTCQVVNCSVLTPPANGTVSPRSCLSRSTYGQTCSFSCNTPGYVLEGTSARVCDKNGEWTGNKDTFCRDNTPPSFNGSCPRNIVVSVPKCSSSTVVSWNEPIASDNSGHMTLSYPAVRPPANLSIGLHYVHYSAADAEGNRANCSFVVQVIKRSCTVLQPPVYGAITSLSCGSAYGSQAVIACNEGHRLVGSRVWSCEANGTWSGNVTTCKIVKCPSIKALANGKISPAPCTLSGGVSYKTECVLQCDVLNGYRLDGPTQVSCLANGSWSGNISNISCNDIQPPSIQCPPNMETPTVVGKSYAIVTWQVPVPTDNSKGFLNLSGLLPPQRMNVGTNVIRYDVTDPEGLKGDCHFSIRVKDLEPPKIDSCPGDTKIISTTRWHKLVLPSVDVTDNVGVELFSTNIQNGSEMTWGEYNVTYKALDRAGNVAYCRFLFTIADSPCEELAPPKNGAKACETWLAGIMCTVHCNNGYAFANQPHPVYFCSPTTGEWFHEGNNKGKTPSLPDCSKTHKPKSALVNGQYHYLTDNCGGETMREEIARNFIELLMRTSFGHAGACSDVSQCNIQNVKVECGVTTRRKRDTSSNQNTTTIPLTVSFSLQIPLSGDLNTSVDINQTSVQISKEVLTVLSKVDMSLNVSGMVIRTDPSKPPQFQLSRLVCEEGQVQSGVMCVNCPIGSFFDGTSCQACAVNQYQDQEAQNSCKSCPAGTSTSGQQASKKLQDCQDQSKTSSKKQSALSKPVIIALIAGGSVVVIVLVLCGVFMMRKRQHPGSESCQNGFSNEAYLNLDELGLQVVMKSSNA